MVVGERLIEMCGFSPLVLQAPADQYLGEPKPYHSTVRHVPPSSRIFKCKDVLESQDAVLQMLLGGLMAKH